MEPKYYITCHKTKDFVYYVKYIKSFDNKHIVIKENREGDFSIETVNEEFVYKPDGETKLSDKQTYLTMLNKALETFK